jgi:prepilin-type N-terminal cleavage/methylation domain-containing protein
MVSPLSVRGACARSERERGFTMTEALVVMAIFAVMVAVALPQFLTYQETFATDSVAKQLVDVARFAHQQALGERQRMRVEITPGTAGQPGKIEVVDEATVAAGTADDEVVRSETLPEGGEISFAKPSGVDVPDSPFNFSPAVYSSGKFVIYFNPIGTSSGTNVDIPKSATVFVAPAGASSTSPNVDLVRAVTIFGPTGSVRLWGYEPSSRKFVKR